MEVGRSFSFPTWVICRFQPLIFQGFGKFHDFQVRFHQKLCDRAFFDTQVFSGSVSSVGPTVGQISWIVSSNMFPNFQLFLLLVFCGTI